MTSEEDTGVSGPGAVTPYASVRYENPDAAIDWLERTLGFTVKELHRDDDGNVVHGEVLLGDGLVMLSQAGIGREPFASIAAAPSITYIAVENVDALHDRAVAAGGDIALGLTDTDYGSRDFTVRDPSGHLWAFGTYRPEATGSG